MGRHDEEVTVMEMFSLTSECKKCGNGKGCSRTVDIGSQPPFASAEYEPAVAGKGTGILAGNPERIIRTCRVCGYQWAEAVISPD